jgi:hypothetical protein
VVFFWVPLCLLGVYLYAELMHRFSGLAPRLTEASKDLAIYRRTGEAILAGEVPYRDFFIEYPPGSLPAFVPPALFSSSRDGYANLFASEMALVLVAALLLTAYAARSLGRPWPLFPAAIFAAGALLLYPVAVTRYDAVVALALATTAALASSPAFARSNAAGAAAYVTAWASLGLGAAAKLVPALVTLPLALLSGRKERTFGAVARGAARGFAVFFGVVAAFLLPALLFGGESFVKSFSYHADRGLQLESIAASVLLKLGYVNGVLLEFGAYDVRGRGADLLSSMSLPVTGVLLLLTAMVAYREHREGRFGSEQFPRFAAASVLAFLLGSKVLSPQYIIWLLPLVPLSAGGIWGLGVSAVFLAVCWMTTQIFPYHYLEISAGRSPGLDILLGRNLLLAVLWGLMLSLPSGSPAQRSTSEQVSPS